MGQCRVSTRTQPQHGVSAKVDDQRCPREKNTPPRSVQLPQFPGVVLSTTTTTAKSQVLALRCAPIIIAKRCPSATKRPPPSMIQWALSPQFRAWAEDWVLTPCYDAVFGVPMERLIVELGFVRVFLCVSVSSTLGLVSVDLFTFFGSRVCGCVGDGKVLLKCYQGGEEHYQFKIFDSRQRGTPYIGVGPIFHNQEPEIRVRCNRKWIVGFPRGESLWVVKVVGGAPLQQQPEHFFNGITPGTLQFSPFSDDTVIVMPQATEKTNGVSCITFVDLDASFQAQELVITSKIELNKMWPAGLLWMPGGSLCVLNQTTESHHPICACSIFLIDCATQAHHFPKFPIVTPIGKNHAHNTTPTRTRTRTGTHTHLYDASQAQHACAHVRDVLARRVLDAVGAGHPAALGLGLVPVHVHGVHPSPLLVLGGRRRLPGPPAPDGRLLPNVPARARAPG
ncbi:hypothetical protein Pelo_5011 [Pelomyxa schiedti]|nr:hypothetical protein Pelo_5011 [Pelomyxa schiedti]